MHMSPFQNARYTGSSEAGQRSKPDLHNKVSDQSNSAEKISSPEVSRHYSANAQPKITSNAGPLRSAGHRLKHLENRLVADQKAGAVESKGHMDHYTGLQQTRILSSINDKEALRQPKLQTVEKEKLYEDTLQLKKQVNALQEENTKLRTKNTHLEKEACKLEKMLEEASTNPNKKGGKSEEGGPPLKQVIRELRSDLDDRESELKSLKKKTKFTKIHELEVQVQAFQEETLRLKAYIDNMMSKKAQMMQEEEKQVLGTQNAEITRLKKEIESLQAANRNYEAKCQDYQKQIFAQDLRFKKEQAQSQRIIHSKDKEIMNLKIQMNSSSGQSTQPISTTTTMMTKKPVATTTTITEGKPKKDAEKSPTKTAPKAEAQVKEDNNAVQRKSQGVPEVKPEVKKPAGQKEFLVRDQEKKDSHSVSVEVKKGMEEEEMKKVIGSPSYQPKSAREEVSHTPKKEEHQPENNNKDSNKQEPVEVKKKKEIKEPAEKKISVDDVKKIGYHINLSFIVKGLTFDAIEKVLVNVNK